VTRRVWAAGITAVGLTSVGALAAGAPSPALVTLSAQHGHIAVVARIGPDQSPYEIEVARSARVLGTGFPRSALVARDYLAAARGGLVRYRTHAKLRAGVYWAAVSARLVDATTCLPVRRGVDCNVEWSRPLRVRVR
jgi:hypothetical protein